MNDLQNYWFLLPAYESIVTHVKYWGKLKNKILFWYVSSVFLTYAKADDTHKATTNVTFKNSTRYIKMTQLDLTMLNIM